MYINARKNIARFMNQNIKDQQEGIERMLISDDFRDHILALHLIKNRNEYFDNNFRNYLWSTIGEFEKWIEKLQKYASISHMSIGDFGEILRVRHRILRSFNIIDR